MKMDGGGVLISDGRGNSCLKKGPECSKPPARTRNLAGKGKGRLEAAAVLGRLGILTVLRIAW